MSRNAQATTNGRGSKSPRRSDEGARSNGLISRLAQSSPGVPGRTLRVFAWLSLIFETTIIGTGGAVRLTGSGLGCSEWPMCTPDSIITTPEMGIHGVIEFGNRMMTSVVGLAALAVVILVAVIRHHRRDLWVLSLLVLGGVVLQAFVGGVVVWLHLHPNLVGFHYLVSVIMVGIAAAFVVRMYEPGGARKRAAPVWFTIGIHISSLLLAVTVVFGILTTGAGPHSGDAEVTIRNGFDATLLQHIHAWPAYILVGLTLLLTVVAAVKSLRPRGALFALLIVEAVQIGVGLYQARHGLPELAVGIHMVLAALSGAAMVWVVLRLKAPVAESVDTATEAAQVATS